MKQKAQTPEPIGEALIGPGVAVAICTAPWWGPWCGRFILRCLPRTRGGQIKLGVGTGLGGAGAAGGSGNRPLPEPPPVLRPPGTRPPVTRPPATRPPAPTPPASQAGGPGWAGPEWGKNRFTKEMHDRGFVLEGPTRSDNGLIYTNPTTGEEIRLMPRPMRPPYRCEHIKALRGRESVTH